MKSKTRHLAAALCLTVTLGIIPRVEADDSDTELAKKTQNLVADLINRFRMIQKLVPELKAKGVEIDMSK